VQQLRFIAYVPFDRNFIDLCKESNCHDNATCDIGLNVTCRCNPGFQGSGQFCEGMYCYTVTFIYIIHNLGIELIFQYKPCPDESLVFCPTTKTREVL
jgi:hypothetical protein